jgi:hypothetical protein
MGSIADMGTVGKENKTDSVRVMRIHVTIVAEEKQ